MKSLFNFKDLSKDRNFLLDSSILIKFFKDEELSECSRLMLQKYTKGQLNIYSLDLAWYELMNFIARNYMPYDGKKLLTDFENSSIKFFPSTFVDKCKSLDLVEKYKAQKISAYDAAYHAFAINTNITFLTADKVYYDKVKKEGNIMWLGDLVLDA